MIALKILQVIPYFIPAHGFGGPVGAAYEISKELSKRGHDVAVYTSDAKDLSQRLSVNPVGFTDGIRVHYFRNLSLLLVRKLMLFITPKLLVHARAETRRFDVIHLHEYSTFQNLVVARCAKQQGVPYVLQTHGSLPKTMTRRKLRWIYDALFGKRLLRDASKVIALSQTEVEQYHNAGVPRERTVVIPNGIDLSEYANSPAKGSFKRKYRVPKHKRIILYVGRIHKTKNIELLIRAHSHLTTDLKHDNLFLVIVGPDDGYLAEAISLADSLGISRSVLFTGFISSKDKTAALTDADVFVTPSFYGFPVTFLEACASGTPIVTTTLGDNLEWIHDNTGFIVPPTAQDLAEAIHRITSNHRLRERFSRNCRRLVRSEFTIEKVVDKVEQVYQEVLQSGTCSKQQFRNEGEILSAAQSG